MSDSAVSSTRTAMTVGAVAGILTPVIPALPILNQYAQIVSISVFVGGIYYGIRIFRDKSGINVYGKLLAAGVKTAFFASVIIAFITYMTAKLNPSVTDVYLQAVSQQLPPDLNETYMDMFRKIISPVFLAASTIVSYTLAGSLAALLCAVVAKNTSSSPKSQ
ncbi:MAG: DUF4199 domain-containing protein [Bacteroidales bacterium]|jgi:hypothetical protein|nr:DUF4199 domain-containing protein [Bacteroidales bacterium]